MWVGGTVSKNDGDIAEFFVRANARTLDHIIILDASEDSSPAIFEKLRQEGHSIEVVNRKLLGMNQVEGINEAMRRAKLLDPDGVFVPLDMDEVLIFRGSDEDLQAAKREFSMVTSPVGSVWSNFAPYHNARRSDQTTFKSVRQIVRNLPPKLIVPMKACEVASISPGNHFAQDSSGRPIPAVIQDRFIHAHFPVRSAKQMSYKLILAVSTLRQKSGRQPWEAQHLIPIMKSFARGGFGFSISDLKQLATGYSGGEYSGRYQKIWRLISRVRVRTLHERYLPSYRPPGLNDSDEWGVLLSTLLTELAEESGVELPFSLEGWPTSQETWHEILGFVDSSLDLLSSLPSDAHEAHRFIETAQS